MKATISILLVSLFITSISAQDIPDNKPGGYDIISRAGFLYLDSIVTQNDPQGTNNYTNKSIFAYDNSGRVIDEISQGWSNGSWVNSHRKLFTYNSNNQVIEELGQTHSTGQWVNSSKQIFGYNANGDQTEYTPLIWENNQWVGSGFFSAQTLWEYDANGLLTTYYFNVWSNGQWTSEHKTEYSYVNDLLQEDVQYKWENSLWEENSKTEYTYDTNGLKISTEGFNWQANQWEIYHKGEYTYDALGREIELIHSYWTNNQWVPDKKITSDFDANGNLTDRDDFSWFNTFWEPFSEAWNLYDNEDNIIQYNILFGWNGNDFSSGERYDYAYDLSVDPYFIARPYIYTYGKNMTTKISSYNAGNWNLFRLLTFYYSGEETPSIIGDLGTYEPFLYPNPSSDFVNLNLPSTTSPTSVSIYDLSGKLIKTETVFDAQRIDVRSLESGSYVMQVRSGQKIYSAPFIKH